MLQTVYCLGPGNYFKSDVTDDNICQTLWISTSCQRNWKTYVINLVLVWSINTFHNFRWVFSLLIYKQSCICDQHCPCTLFKEKLRKICKHVFLDTFFWNQWYFCNRHRVWVTLRYSKFLYTTCAIIHYCFYW